MNWAFIIAFNLALLWLNQTRIARWLVRPTRDLSNWFNHLAVAPYRFWWRRCDLCGNRYFAVRDYQFVNPINQKAKPVCARCYNECPY